mmetsp:Transcript_95260/g.169132  ORF Transcript_95260/g.169132 Transcript_95260/m.169132 type:complete len:84 (-) Transcript_95260:136-387(-)
MDVWLLNVELVFQGEGHPDHDKTYEKLDWNEPSLPPSKAGNVHGVDDGSPKKLETERIGHQGEGAKCRKGNMVLLQNEWQEGC